MLGRPTWDQQSLKHKGGLGGRTDLIVGPGEVGRRHLVGLGHDGLAIASDGSLKLLQPGLFWNQIRREESSKHDEKRGVRRGESLDHDTKPHRRYKRTLRTDFSLAEL